MASIVVTGESRSDTLYGFDLCGFPMTAWSHANVLEANKFWPPLQQKENQGRKVAGKRKSLARPPLDS
jgi:hypothetical protein